MLSFRVLQAIGAALLQANSVALIRTTVAPGRLNRAIGVQGAAQALGRHGPTIGGLLIAAGGWRWVFWVNLPVSAIGLGAGVLLLPRTRIGVARTASTGPASAACCRPPAPCCWACPCWTADRGRASDWCCSGWPGWRASGCSNGTRRHPCCSSALLRDRTLRAGLAGALLRYLVLFGVLLLCPLFVETRLQSSVAQTGLLVSILPGMLAVLAPVAGLAADRVRAGPVTTAGLLLTALGCGCGAVLAGRLTGLVLLLVLVGAGLGLFTPAYNATVAGRGRPEQAGLGERRAEHDPGYRHRARRGGGWRELQPGRPGIR